MKKIASTLIVAAALAYADGLYTISYLPQSPIESSVIDTGIPAAVDANTLRTLRTKTAFNLYFDGEDLSHCSKQRLQNVIGHLQENEYIALIGHSSATREFKEDRYLNGWERLWQGMLDSRPTADEAVKETNRRLRYIYDLLVKGGVNADRIYTENRLDRDPITTEATKKGSAYNRRVQVLILR